MLLLHNIFQAALRRSYNMWDIMLLTLWRVDFGGAYKQILCTENENEKKKLN